MRFLAVFLGLGRPTALALLAFGLQLAKVLRASLGDLLPTLPSKFDGGGIFLFWQNSEDVALAPDRIMHDASAKQKRVSVALAPQLKEESDGTSREATTIAARV
jgi:hypothetical protein